MIMVSGRSSSSEESSESSSGVAGALLPQGGLPNGGGPPHLVQHSSPPDQPPSLVNSHVIGGHQQVQQQQQSSSPPQQPLLTNNNPHTQSHSSSGVTPPTTGNGSVCPPPPIDSNNHILVTLQEKRIIQEFCHLLEKSKQLFNQLRDLPPHFSTLGAAYNPQNHSNGILTSSHHQILGGSVASSASTGGAGGPGAATLSCQQAYFSRAFDIYTRLWKFQQMHRATLDKKYGLKRWQIGDIASKIGQLYFHYYLRTSELAYLQEAHSFYGAIRARGYYAARSSGRSGNNAARRDSSRSSEVIDQNGPGHQESSGLIVKKLRYYARFIVVSLLLRKHNVKDLLRELSLQVENYVATVDDEPEEQLEWNLVLSEIRSFIEADSPVVVVDNCTDKLVDPIMDTFLILSHRLPRSELVPKNYRPLNPSKDSSLLSSPTAASPSCGSSYKLHEILIVGNKQDQLKFSELTVDMFRMTQTFERALPVECTAINTSSSERCANNILSLSGGEMISSGYDGGKNPHKYLLYRAPIEQILVTLNAAWSDLPWNGVLLIYISGDPCAAALNQGIATTSLKGHKHHHIKSVPPFDSPKGISSAEESSREINCLYPSDLIPLTRKPLFFIVDSDNSGTFLDLTREKNNFGKPLVVLMSPEVLSNNTGSNVASGLPTSTRGSIFTLFLHCPLAGLCALAGVKSISLTTWNQLEHLLNIFLSEAFDRILVVHRQEQQDSSNQPVISSWDVYIKLMPDDFLRLIILRFLFCQVVFELHKDFQNPQLRPKCYPEVNLLEGDDTSRFEELITDMADLIQAKHLFNHLI